MPTTYAIPNGATAMTATLYTGNGATQNVTNSTNGTVGFNPDFTWYKSRSNSSWNHGLFDSVRGTTKQLFSNTTGAEGTYSGVTAFNSNGFSVGSDNGGNQSGGSMVAWQWNAGSNTTSSNTSGSVTSTVSVNQTAGFSIISWAGGQGANYTIGHGLSTTPSFFIAKSRGSAENWGVYYTNNGVNTNWMTLNSTAAQGSQTGSLAGGAFVILNSTTIQIDAGSYANANNSMIGYCWAAIPGFSAFGKYTGNGSADGPFVYTGFRPKFVMTKKSNAAESWVISDSSRSTYNVTQAALYPNSTSGDDTVPQFDFLSNGFKLRASHTVVNANGDNYIYAAFAENPFKYANAR